MIMIITSKCEIQKNICLLWYKIIMPQVKLWCLDKINSILHQNAQISSMYLLNFLYKISVKLIIHLYIVFLIMLNHRHETFVNILYLLYENVYNVVVLIVVILSWWTKLSCKTELRKQNLLFKQRVCSWSIVKPVILFMHVFITYLIWTYVYLMCTCLKWSFMHRKSTMREIHLLKVAFSFLLWPKPSGQLKIIRFHLDWNWHSILEQHNVQTFFWKQTVRA